MDTNRTLTNTLASEYLRGVTVDDLMEFGVWIVTLEVGHPTGPCENADTFISEVPVCARDMQCAQTAAVKWVVDDDMVPLRVIQARYICGVKAISVDDSSDGIVVMANK